MISISQRELNTRQLQVQWSASPDIQPSTWVKLLQLPTPYSFDEALLLCQESEERWLAWVPDCGEVVLHRSEFYQS